jgi:hypothetical protein
VDSIITDEQAKLIADFANGQTKRLITFCKKNKDIFGESPHGALITIYAVNIVAILKAIELKFHPTMTPEELRKLVISVLDYSLQLAIKK